MAYQKLSKATYIGADDVSVLNPTDMIHKFKVESNLIDPIDMIDDLEVADGFNGWTVERLADNVIVHTANWDTESQYDAWKAAWGEVTPGADWTVESLETAD